MSASSIEAPNLLQLVFDNVGAALLVIGSEGRLVFTNPAFATLFGENRAQSPMHLADWARTLLEHNVYRAREIVYKAS